MFLKNRWGFSNEDNKSVAKAENGKSPGFSYAENWLTDCIWFAFCAGCFGIGA